MKIDLRLIQKPEKQSRVRRTLWGVVTGVFWLIYAYLWLPLLTLILWMLGVRTAVFELYMREHAVEPFLLIALPVIAVLATLIMGIWAEYNRARFAGTDRRRRADNIPIHVVADDLGANQSLAASMATAKIIVLHMDDNARPVRATVRKLPTPKPMETHEPPVLPAMARKSRGHQRAKAVSAD